jgi:hypothetical protein
MTELSEEFIWNRVTRLRQHNANFSRQKENAIAVAEFAVLEEQSYLSIDMVTDHLGAARICFPVARVEYYLDAGRRRADFGAVLMNNTRFARREESTGGFGLH